MEKVSFVIPCYRSEATIGAVIQEIETTMAALSSRFDYEVVLVNDSSPDGTWTTISGLQAEKHYITGIDLAKNFGQHAALMAGFHYANGDIIICLDDDGQTPADEVGKLLDKLTTGYDVVYASYEKKMQASFRNFGSMVNSKMMEIMLGKPRDLVINSYFGMRRFIMEEMLRYEQCYPYVIGLVLRSTKNICNVSVKHRQRQQGKSGYTLGKLLSLWMNGFTSFSVKPLRVATYFGVLSAVIGFLYTIVIFVRYFAYAAAPTGWSSSVAIQLVMGGVILIVLGLIGEYVGRLYMCVNASPQYVIRSVVSENEKE